MGFKEMVSADIANVIMNTAEFAEYHTVRYDGENYKYIPIVLQNVKQSDRPVVQSDNMEGIFLVTAVAYLNLKDLGGIVPEQGQYFEIDDGEALGKPFFKKYSVVTSKCEMGLVTLELRCFDE